MAPATFKEQGPANLPDPIDAGQARDQAGKWKGSSRSDSSQNRHQEHPAGRGRRPGACLPAGGRLQGNFSLVDFAFHLGR